MYCNCLDWPNADTKYPAKALLCQAVTSRPRNILSFTNGRRPHVFFVLFLAREDNLKCLENRRQTSSPSPIRLQYKLSPLKYSPYKAELLHLALNLGDIVQGGGKAREEVSSGSSTDWNFQYCHSSPNLKCRLVVQTSQTGLMVQFCKAFILAARLSLDLIQRLFFQLTLDELSSL